MDAGLKASLASVDLQSMGASSYLCQGEPMKAVTKFVVILLCGIAVFAQESKQAEAPAVSIVGYVRDSGCVHRFHEVVKPLLNGCVEACVRGGSPLVVLTKNEQVYHPISADMPDVDVRQKLLPFVGKLVKVTGHVYSRGGSNAISLEQIEEVKE
jgi:hypothetical protein